MDEPNLSKLSDEAVTLARKMARAAGPQRASTMGQAAYMLLCLAAMTKDPEGYFKWLDQRKEQKR